MSKSGRQEQARGGKRTLEYFGGREKWEFGGLNSSIRWGGLRRTQQHQKEEEEGVCNDRVHTNYVQIKIRCKYITAEGSRSRGVRRKTG